VKAATPRATIGLAVATAAGFVILSGLARGPLGEAVGGFIPARLSGLAIDGALPVWLTPLSATLIHAGVLHLAFNLLLLVFCGREDEVALGPGGVLVLYGVGAYAAAAAEWAALPHSAVPMVGASGAISALVGAYALLYGQRRSSRLPREVARWLHILWLAAAWIGLQLLVGLASATSGVVVATPAHVGGFVAGLLLARPLLRWRYRKA